MRTNAATRIYVARRRAEGRSRTRRQPQGTRCRRRSVTPELCELPGVGSVVTACVLVAWSQPGRVRSGAAFAALAGTPPIPASSVNTVRQRLNHGGDHRLNRALTTVVHLQLHAPASLVLQSWRSFGVYQMPALAMAG